MDLFVLGARSRSNSGSVLLQEWPSIFIVGRPAAVQYGADGAAPTFNQRIARPGGRAAVPAALDSATTAHYSLFTFRLFGGHGGPPSILKQKKPVATCKGDHRSFNTLTNLN